MAASESAAPSALRLATLNGDSRYGSGPAERLSCPRSARFGMNPVANQQQAVLALPKNGRIGEFPPSREAQSRIATKSQLQCRWQYFCYYVAY